MNNNISTTTKYIPRDQMQSILDNRPKGVDGKALIDKFVADGYKVEGVNADTPVATPEKPLTEKLKDRISQVGEGVSDYVAGGKELINNIKTGQTTDTKSDVKGGAKILSGIFGGINDTIGSALDAIGVTDVVRAGITSLPQDTQVKLATTIKQFGEEYDKVAPQGSTQDEVLRALGNVLAVVPISKGGKVIKDTTKALPDVVEAGVTTFKNVLPTVSKFGIKPEFASNVVKSVVEQTSGVTRKTQETLLKSARDGSFETKFSDAILANPAQAENDVIRSLTTSLNDMLVGKGKLSEKYAPVLAQSKPFAFSRQKLINDVVDATKLKYDIKRGFYKTPDTVNLAESDLKKLNSLVDSYVGVKQLTPDQFMTLRTAIGELAYDGGIKSTTGEFVSRKLYDSVNKNYRGNINGLAELDAELSPVYKDIQELSEYFAKDPRTGALTVSDNAMSKLATLLNRNKDQKLARIEQFIPDIQDKLEYANALRNLDVAQGNMVGLYGRAGSQIGSVIVGGSVAGIPGAVASLIANSVIQNPTFIANRIKQIGKMTKKTIEPVLKDGGIYSLAEKKDLYQKVIKPQLDKVGIPKNGETIIYYSGDGKSGQYVNTNLDEIWGYPVEDLKVKKVKTSALESTGSPEKDAIGYMKIK